MDKYRTQFQEYFLNGLNVAEAIKYHTGVLELKNAAAEFMLDESLVCPDSSTVTGWYDEWKVLNLQIGVGSTTIQMLTAKLNVYRELGYKVALHIDPLVIVILTPIMQRAHALDEASWVVYLKSTSGCDRENHSLTVAVTPCAAGAIPVGVIVSRPYDLKLALDLFNAVAEPNSFGSRGSPSTVVFDDCEFLRDALREVWSNSNIKISLAHVERSSWAWLWNERNCIAVEDRKHIMNSFQRVFHSLDISDSTRDFNEAMDSNLWSKYPPWQHYAASWWDKRELWRHDTATSSNTNSSCDFVLRLYINVVMGRCNSFGVVTVIDFICTVMEDYCQSCLVRFAHKPLLLFQNHLTLNSSLDKMDVFSVDEVTFSVQSDLQSDAYFSINCKLGSCTCQLATSSEFCRHLFAVWQRTGVRLPSLPRLDNAARQQMVFLGLGDKKQSEALCTDLLLSADSYTDEVCANRSAKCSDDMLLTVEMIVDSDEDGSDCESFSCILAKMADLNHLHGSKTSATRKMLKRLSKINTAKQWTKFLLTHGAGLSLSFSAAPGKPKNTSI